MAEARPAGPYAVASADVDLGGCEPQRMECEQMIVRQAGCETAPELRIAWTALPKHADVYATTNGLPLALLERCGGDQPPDTEEPQQ